MYLYLHFNVLDIYTITVAPHRKGRAVFNPAPLLEALWIFRSEYSRAILLNPQIYNQLFQKLILLKLTSQS